MSQTLKIKLTEADHPVGVPRQPRYTLPPESFVYGLKIKRDAEGVSTVTRSWKVHEPSPGRRFQKTLLTEESGYEGFRTRKYEIPPPDFVYGLKTRTGTPIKNVVNNVYGRKAEEEIRKSYADIVEDKNIVRRLVTKGTPHFRKLREINKLVRYGPGEEKPLYKLKMFQDVGSKVTEGIKQFRTYGWTTGNMEGGLDKVIAKVQNEIEEAEKKEATTK